ncbi:hypothetical protein GNIT_2487 [Glaciecola nitratireducens FR1064]|uniref:Uncharacterized protein n=1 Tax=Glaciecola nitratireducens (strain JCM 12485 / KCTC 12276 / FR1064) TaxID=1085623 RepID=G4QM13_GLANF|nr:hypothetical protein GNIT_2487 [Glaciecola nitratireducens FR1064]
MTDDAIKINAIVFIMLFFISHIISKLIISITGLNACDST